MRTTIIRLVAMCGLVLGTLTLGAAASANGGNSDAAHACQRGGYANYTRTDGTGFANTGQCVSYAAQGGQLVVKPSLTVTNRLSGGVALQTFTGSGLLPGSAVVVHFTTLNGGSGTLSLGTVSADGTFSLVDAGTSCNFVKSETVSATTASGGTITADATPPCSPVVAR